MNILFESISKVINFIINQFNSNIGIILKNPLMLLIISILILRVIWNLLWQIIGFLSDRKKTKEERKYYKKNKDNYTSFTFDELFNLSNEELQRKIDLRN